MPKYYGIDLGTTTTLIAGAKLRTGASGYTSEILKISQFTENGEVKATSALPSVAYFPEQGEPLVGLEARTKGALDPHNHYVRAVKRLMGRDAFPFVFHGKSYSPSDVSSLYIRYAIENVEDTDGKIEAVTVTVPASFTTFQRLDTRKAVRKALEDAGHEINEDAAESLLISEPLAALINYIAEDIHEKLGRVDLTNNPRVLVYDIGGGTLDLTLVRLGLKDPSAEFTIQNVAFDIEEVGRYNEVGGEDFDELIGRYLLDRLMEQHPILEKRDLDDGERVNVRYAMMDVAERVKVDFSDLFGEGEDLLEKTYDIRITGDHYKLIVKLDLDAMKDILEPLLGESDDPKNLVAPINAMLEGRGLIEGEVDVLLGVGGMINFLPLQEALRDRVTIQTRFAPLPQEAVAAGAAIYSMLRELDEEIREPAADDNYIKLEEGFRKVLPRSADYQEIKTTLNKADDSSVLLLHFYSGDSCKGDYLPPESIPSLMYQGGDVVDLGRVVPEGTLVDVFMRYQGADKIPLTRVLVDGDEVYSGVVAQGPSLEVV